VTGGKGHAANPRIVYDHRRSIVHVRLKPLTTHCDFGSDSGTGLPSGGGPYDPTTLLGGKLRGRSENDGIGSVTRRSPYSGFAMPSLCSALDDLLCVMKMRAPIAMTVMAQTAAAIAFALAFMHEIPSRYETSVLWRNCRFGQQRQQLTNGQSSRRHP
jgi:hypothetical protein